MKKILQLAGVLTVGLAFGQSGYCLPEFQYNADGNMITHVQFADIDQESPFQSGTTPQYEDFTSVSTNVDAGEIYEISVKAPSSTFPSDIMVFIDFNQNGNLDDEGESFYIGRVEPANPFYANTITSDILIPAGALAGETRLRVLKNTNVAAYSDPDAPNSISGPCATDLRAGQTEDYTVNIIGQDIVICEPSEPGENPGDLGCVNFIYQGQTVGLITVRAADGNIWLQQNLGSSQVATAYNDEAAYGDLFQWGRFDDGHQLRSSNQTDVYPDPNNPTGLGEQGNPNFFIGGGSPYDTYDGWWGDWTSNDKWEATSEEVTATNALDPCKKIGEDWSIPTESDWENVIESEQIGSDENVENIVSAFESNLKLTTGGVRKDDEFAFVGTRGYYWSRSLSSNEDFVKYLYYSNYIVNPNAGDARKQGSSVRCLQIADTVIEIENVTITTENNAEPEITINGGTLQLIATIEPAEANQEVTWSVTEGEELAEVNENGLVTAIDNGEVTIRATSVEDETIFGEITLLISGQGLSINDEDFTQLNIYPNPTKGLLNISSDLSVKSIEVFEIGGKKVLKSGNKKLDLSALSNATYILKIEFENGRMQTVKVIKN